MSVGHERVCGDATAPGVIGSTTSETERQQRQVRAIADAGGISVAEALKVWEGREAEVWARFAEHVERSLDTAGPGSRALVALANGKPMRIWKDEGQDAWFSTPAEDDDWAAGVVEPITHIGSAFMASFLRGGRLLLVSPKPRTLADVAAEQEADQPGLARLVADAAAGDPGEENDGR